VAPRAGLSRIEAEGGGLRDAVWLVVLGAIAFRFPRLLESLLGLAGPSSGWDVLAQAAGVVAGEVQRAAWVVLPAAVIVTLLAGRRRDPSSDLELGAACYAPYFVITGVFRAIDAVTGARTFAPLVPEVVGGLGALAVLVPAVRLGRARPPRDAAASVAVAPPPPPPPLRRWSLLAGVAVLALAAVGLTGNAVWASRHVDSLRPLSTGQPAPGFALRRADQPGSLALDDLRGQVVVLDFWATWCPPCQAMVPVLHDLHREWSPRGVAFVGIDSEGGDDDGSAVHAFLQAHPAPYPIVVDDGSANMLYKVRALPELVIIGRDGKIRRTFLGYTGKETVARAIAATVGE
jgi:thiol-disulfide isomerase/thioredoxin